MWQCNNQFPCTLWRPCHLEYVPDIDMLGDRPASLLLRIALIVLSVTLPIHREIETVERDSAASVVRYHLSSVIRVGCL
jgi:hypothetical protein